MKLQDEPDGSEPELIAPEDFLPASRLPADAQRMGIDRWTGGEAGFLAVAAALDSRKRSHRLFAMVLLVGVVACFLLTVWGQWHYR